jgi:hypothetical protein
MDGTLIVALFGDSMQQTSQTEIPSEPFYLIMNTAISKDWAFPDAYFLDCKHKCWSCFDPRCAQCALPKGYCRNFPAFFEIDFVRVYQVKDDNSTHTLGCSPPSRPTKSFIEARIDRYKLDAEKGPLQPVVSGGGPCTTENDCGTLKRGDCLPARVCACTVSWTGPNCLAHFGFDDKETGKAG